MKMKPSNYILVAFCIVLWERIEAVINENSVKNFVKGYHRHQAELTIHKVSFTQKGYIQFLRYIVEVPPINDYTFCIWVRSNNLTYSHPLLSYSKHEDERLIRVWISPGGSYINLEILEHPIFRIPIHIVENHWYHICQSWSTHQGFWSFYFNGKLKSSGFTPQLKGFTIKGGGDIVVGQEYTDVDKGLDDGIEGDVFGFNFVLSPTSYLPLHRHDINRKRDTHLASPYPLATSSYSDIPDVLSYFPVGPNRNPKGLPHIFENAGFFNQPIRRVAPNQHKRIHMSSRIVNDIEDFSPKPTGLKLAELSYNCFLGRGSPVSGRDVLISWTKTPVRVFGGAILKNILPFCT